MKKARRLPGRQAGAHADPPRGRRLDDAPVAPGFRLVSCVRRQMEEPGEPPPTPSAPPVIQTHLLRRPDLRLGLHRAVSPDRHTEPVFVASARPSTFGQRQGDWWVTWSATRRRRRSRLLLLRSSAKSRRNGCRAAKPHTRRFPDLFPRLRQVFRMQPLLRPARLRAGRYGFAALALVARPVRSAAPPRRSAQGLPDFTDLVEKVGPAVVNIRTTERPAPRRGPGGEIDEDMLEFFRRFGIPAPSRPNPRTPQQPATAMPQPRGVGSGFILNADGYVHDQRPCGRRRRRGDRHPGRQARVQGQDHRRRQALRRRARPDRRERPADRAHRRRRPSSRSASG